MRTNIQPASLTRNCGAPPMRLLMLAFLAFTTVAGAATNSPCLPNTSAVLDDTYDGPSETADSVQDQLTSLVETNTGIAPGSSVTTKQVLEDGSVARVTVSLAGDGSAYTETWSLAPASKQSRTLSLTNFLPRPGDPGGPQTGTFTSLDEKGVGGYLRATDNVILQCPPNPSSLPATTQLVRRQYLANDGTTHSRTDTLVSAGQLAAGDQVEGVQCRIGSGKSLVVYSMTKLEDGAGDTVQATSSLSPPTASNPCDPAFGSVPSVTNNAADYNFASTPTFPAEW